MSDLSAPKIAIIIPARNEEARIGTCLNALVRQCTPQIRVILVVNNTTDNTSKLARAVAASSGLKLIVLERNLARHQGVGTARQIGCDHALRTMEDLQCVLTTDADCIVSPQWLARNLAHLKVADAVCGKVELIAEEAVVLNGMDPKLAAYEGIYRKLVQEFYSVHSPGCADIADSHGEAAGASLAFTKSAYLASGGFEPVRCGEDRQIIRNLRRAGGKVHHAGDVTVQASCRLTGRASGGMSDALKARIGGGDYLIDECLPPADWLIRHAGCRTLGPWPPQVPARFRLNVRELPDHIEMLKTYRNSGRSTEALQPPAIASHDSSHPQAAQHSQTAALQLPVSATHNPPYRQSMRARQADGDNA